ncbi:hypothetical protein CcrC1_gp351 [Caulobacter phage C1]|nr:hypothetical protein CcrC1_gp351 [Caulobacter phage C1]UTU08580.1 hypothetical protein CcrC2_gp352 [Caulobacter phage C2]UTU09096.1 hypothetical protein CcrJ4_gp347 [Caulobacter phage J4]UTU09654.1 hypothetical protein CcrBL47_gp369 [Caulobacter phage BL47]UTU10213.1 hypothetical protein CcrRB23_gp351 [Caulobacter phage RB23]WGN97247.1 hypothetical protein [Bertelyvirus sp.]
MLVWVLTITIFYGNNAGVSVHQSVVDNIASAESCKQLAKVHTWNNSNQYRTLNSIAVCAPVRKAKV